MKKYVLTGGPGVGKTTVIKILASMGYEIVPEAARIIIEVEKIKDSDVLPWKNLQKFQEKVAELQIKTEKMISGEIIFQDRSIIDGMAYCKLGNVIPPEIIEIVARGRYDKIFVLNSLTNCEQDGTRRESFEEAKYVHLAIIEVYKSFGYEPIFVPVLPPRERVEFILNNL